MQGTRAELHSTRGNMFFVDLNDAVNIWFGPIEVCNYQRMRAPQLWTNHPWKNVAILGSSLGGSHFGIAS